MLGSGRKGGKFLGEWGDDVGKVRKDVGVGRSVGRGEGNVGMYV